MTAPSPADGRSANTRPAHRLRIAMTRLKLAPNSTADSATAGIEPGSSASRLTAAASTSACAR